MMDGELKPWDPLPLFTSRKAAFIELNQRIAQTHGLLLERLQSLHVDETSLAFSRAQNADLLGPNPPALEQLKAHLVLSAPGTIAGKPSTAQTREAWAKDALYNHPQYAVYEAERASMLLIIGEVEARTDMLKREIRRLEFYLETLTAWVRFFCKKS